MRYSSRTSRTIGVTVCLVAAVALTSAAPTSLDFVRPASRESRLDTIRKSNRDSTPNERDVGWFDADSVVVPPSTSTDYILYHTITAQPTSFMASPPGGVILEPINNVRSSHHTPNMLVADSCSTATSSLTGPGFHVALLVLLACTLATTIFIVVHLVRRQRLLDSFRSRNQWPSVNLYSPSDTPKDKHKQPLSISVDTALKHKGSASTLSSIPEEPSTPGRTVAFASPRDLSRPPSYTVSSPDSPTRACLPLSPFSPQRTVAEGQQSSFLPLRG